MSQQVFTQVFPSDPDLLPEIEDYVIGILKNINFNEEKLDPIALSVAEAASNSIVHGNKCDVNKSVKVTVILNNGTLVLKFKDQGEGFNPKEVPDPTAPENILKDSGRGLHIMNTFLDSLSYNFSEEGTEAVLEIKM